jgi:O-antigen/teichoic acid export membrane protein
MAETRPHKSFLRDLFWYSLGTIIPILASLIRTPIFTRYFSAAEFGLYGLVFISFSIISVFTYTWMANAIWRFYYKFKKLNKLDTFYANLIFLFISASVVFIILLSVWVLISRNTALNRLVVLMFAQTFLTQLVSFLLIVFRLENKARLYTTVHSFRAIVSLSLQCVITFIMGMRIEAIPVATLITEFLVLVVVLKPIRQLITIRFELVSRRIMWYIGSYFLPGIMSNISTILLTLSDRYVISIFGTMSEVGIYNQIYNFAQISIVACISIFMAVINPEFLNILEEKPEKIQGVSIKYHLIYLIFIFPVAVYLSIFAEPITNILFGQEFRVGYTMVPFIVFSYYINGLTSFHDTKFKFENRYRIVIIGVILGTLLNLVLNFIFIPLYGYKMAAVTTFIAYVFLFAYYQYFNRSHLVLDRKFRNTLLIICGIMLMQTVIHYLLKIFFKLEGSLVNTLIEGSVYIILYASIVALLFRKTLKQLMIKEQI